MSVDVQAILHELAHERGEQAEAGASTATMTLLAYCDDRGIAKWLRDRAGTVVNKHPARLVLLDATLAPDHQETDVSRAEWIGVGCRGLDPGVLASIAHALSIPGVPTVLLWAGAHVLSDPVFAVLNAIADSLVLDSSRSEEDEDTLHDLTEYFAQAHRFAVQDLAYLRLSPWQEMIAEFFDERAFIDDLFSLRSAEIAAGSSAEAYYLLGWLASRLEWSASGPNQFSNRFGASISFAVQKVGQPRRIQRVTLQSADSIFDASLAEDGITVCLSVRGAKAREPHCSPLHDVDVVSLIERAILEPHTSDVFRTSLDAVRSILDRQRSAN